MSVLDESHLREICGDDSEFMAAVLHEYTSDGAASLVLLRQAVNEGDAESAKSILHRMKGASASAGAKEMAALAGALETQVGCEGIAAVRGRIGEVEETWDRLLEHVGRRLPEAA